MNVVENAPWILAIDPGKATGWAMYDLVENEVYFGELGHADDVAQFVRDVVGMGATIEIVAEQFIISERTIKTKLERDALDILGWLRLETAWWGVPLTLQTAAQAKDFVPDSTLKTIGWFNPTKDGHQNDALRHLFRYLVRTYPNHAGPLLEMMNDD